MKCGYHTIGVIYDTMKVHGNHSKFGVINTSQCHISHHIFDSVELHGFLELFCQQMSVAMHVCTACLCVCVCVCVPSPEVIKS